MSQKDSNIKIIPLGGCGEIGMNMTVFHIDGRHFFVDCGALFADSSDVGVNLILPQTTYLDERNIRPEAWLITHGHEDHIGALPYLFKKYPAPIYGTEFTIELIKAKFIDAGITNAVFNVWHFYKSTSFRLDIKVTPFPVNHSIADAAGLFVETRLGNILHMGDFRIDYSPPEKSSTHENLKRVLKDKPVTLMMSDSTNSFQQGTDNSESNVPIALANYFAQCKGAVIVSTFASNIWRLQAVLEAAKKTGRKVCLFGRTMLRNVEIARKLGIINFSDDTLFSFNDINLFERSKVCVLCTGSQGEVFSGLHRLAWGNISEFQINTEDLVLMSSRIIPGNEKSIDSIVTQLARIGCPVVTTKENSNIHVSGHGFAGDLVTCIQIAKPLAFMPVHGTYRHLKQHRELAIANGVAPENCFLVENGDVVLAAPHPHGVIDTVPSGRDFVCPGGIYAQNSSVYKDRASLSWTGVVAVTFACQHNTWKLACLPQVGLRGLQLDVEKLQAKLPRIYEQTLENMNRRKRFDTDMLQDELRVAVRRYLEKILGFKTVVIVLFQKV